MSNSLEPRERCNFQRLSSIVADPITRAFRLIGEALAAEDLSDVDLSSICSKCFHPAAMSAIGAPAETRSAIFFFRSVRNALAHSSRLGLLSSCSDGANLLAIAQHTNNGSSSLQRIEVPQLHLGMSDIISASKLYLRVLGAWHQGLTDTHDNKEWAELVAALDVGSNERDELGRTRLITACIDGDEAGALRHIDAGADTQACANDGTTALLAANSTFLIEVLAKLLAEKPDPLKVQVEAYIRALRMGQRDPYQGKRVSILFDAIKQKRSNLALLLIHNNANVNVRDVCGNSPFRYACLEGMADVAVQLVQHGLVVDRVDSEGDTAMTLAALHFGDDTSVMTALLNRQADVEASGLNDFTRKPIGTALVFACFYKKSTRTAHLLLDRKACVNPSLSNADRGCTPLIAACMGGTTADLTQEKEDLALRLLELGANVHVVSNMSGRDGDPSFNESALPLACQHKMWRVASKLIKIGADLNATAPGWRHDSASGLMFATSYRQVAIMEELLAAGADAAFVNESGVSAMHIAEGDVQGYGWNPEAVQLLKKYLQASV